MRTVSAYRLPSREPVPQPYRRAGASERPPLVQFVLLSMALHALLILMFGAPSGGSREGRAMWGALNVELVPLTVPGPGLRLDRGAGSQLPEIAAPKKPRAAREPPPKPERPLPVPEPAKPAPPELKQEITPPATFDVRPPAAPLEPEPRVEPVQPLFAPLPKLEPLVTPEFRREILPSVQAPPAEVPVPPAAPPPPPAPAPPQPERAVAPRVEQPPAEAAPIAAPLVQPVQPAPQPPAEHAPTPPVERTPMEVPTLPVPPIERAAPPRVEPVAPRIEPSTTLPESATRELQPAPPPPAMERTEPRPPQRAEPPASERQVPARVEPPLRAPVAPPAGRGSDVFVMPRDAPPAATEAGKDLRIDLDAARKRARELAREGTGNRAVLPFPMPPVPERKSKMEIAIEKARKPDCRTAYADMGLLAVIPLVANEFGEGNCRW